MYKQFKFYRKVSALILSSADEVYIDKVCEKIMARKPALLQGLKTLITLNTKFDNHCLQTTLDWLDEAPLESIQLENADIDDAGLKMLPPDLKRLALTGTSLSRASFWEIQNFTQLEAFVCGCVHAIREGGFNFVPPLDTLKTIVFDGSGFDRPKSEIGFSPTLEHLSNFVNLSDLGLASTGLVPDDLGQLARCESLEFLDLSWNPGVGLGLVELFEKTRLKALDLSHCDLRSVHIDTISNCEELEDLCYYGNCKVNDHTLNEFVKLKKLKKLRLSKGRFGQESVKSLFQNSNFCEANFVSCDLPELFGALLESSFLKKLVVKNSNFDVDALNSAIKCLTLRYLDIRSTEAAWDVESINKFRESRPDCVLITS